VCAAAVVADLTTSQLRTAWSPACDTSKFVVVTLPAGNGAKVTIDSRGASYFRRVHDIMYAWNWDPPQGTTGAYNCRQITGGTGYSLHAYGIAGDYDWDNNPYGSTLITNMPTGMVDEISAIRTVNGDNVFRWGGTYSGNKDAMHYELIASPTTLSAGIRPVTCSASGSSGQCVHTTRCSGAIAKGDCPGAASVQCCTGTVTTKRAGGGSSGGGTSGGGGTTYGSCTSSGTTGTCKDVSSCNGITATGLCPGSSSIQCCTNPVCTAGSNGAGKCLKVASCTSGYSFSGYCPGDSTIRCCTRPVSGAAESDVADFINDLPYNVSDPTHATTGTEEGGDPEDSEGVSGASSTRVSLMAVGVVALAGRLVANW